MYPAAVFTLRTSTPIGRRGQLRTPHGTIETPFFMPVGTAGAMKGITHEDLIALGAQILLCNTYHLHVSPGETIVKEAGGLHRFIGWDLPILTDSGGYQVYSLRRHNAVEDHGVTFHSHLTGEERFMGPAESMAIQHALGADIIMCFDECPPSTAPRAEIARAVDRTLRWAKECKRIHAESGSHSLLFGIVQGGLERDLREKCAQELQEIGFDGYALGGLAVGESEADMLAVVQAAAPLLPEDRPRYLMGVGEIGQLRTCVRAGIDMFDCVLPMRLARHGTLIMGDGSTIRIVASQYRTAHEPIDPESPSPMSRTHGKSYLNHLLRTKERLGEHIAEMQNLGVTLKTMQDLRAEISE